MSEVKCRRMRWLLALYGSGELSPQEQAMVEEHLASCDRCRQELAKLNEVPALIQSLHGDTWWADVTLQVRERLPAGAENARSRVKPTKAAGRGVITGAPTWQQGRIGSIAAAVMERPIWQTALVGLLVILIVVVASMAALSPWDGSSIGQLATKAARDNLQVQTLLGEEEAGSEVIIAGELARVEFSTEYVLVTAWVDTESMKVMGIHRVALIFQPLPPPIYRPELTPAEKAEAIQVARAHPRVQTILSHGLALGEPISSHPIIGADTRRLAWLPLEGDKASDEYSGVLVDLGDLEDVTIMWGGELPSWWPFIQ